MKTKILWILLFSLIILPTAVNAVWVEQKSHYAKDNFICEIYFIDYSYDFRSVNVGYLNDKTQIPVLYFLNQDINTITCTNTTGDFVSYNLENITITFFHNHYEWTEPMQQDWKSLALGPLGTTINVFKYAYQQFIASNVTPDVIKNTYVYDGDSRAVYLPFKPEWFAHGDSGQINLCYYFDTPIPEEIYWSHNSPNDCYTAFPSSHVEFRNYEANSDLCSDDSALALYNESIQQVGKYSDVINYATDFAKIIYEVWLIFYWIIRIGILVGVVFGVVYLIFWAYNYIKKVIE